MLPSAHLAAAAAFFGKSQPPRHARPSRIQMQGRSNAESWVSDDEDDNVQRAVHGIQNIPTSEELLELSGEDSLDQIRELVLRGRGLQDGAIGPLLAPLASLEVLSLSNNSVHALSSDWPALANLTTLNINFNGLTSLEPLVGCKRLECLYAASNRIGSIASLARLAALRVISLFRNRLGSLDGCLDVLGGLPALEELDLGANPCATGPAYRHTLVSRPFGSAARRRRLRARRGLV